jgi:hypothetical protein
MVMSFTDSDLRAIVETAQISNPDAEDYLVDVLAARRDRIGRHWFEKIPPLDRFSVPAASASSQDAKRLQFDDLSVTTGLQPAATRRYTYQLFLDEVPLGTERSTRSSHVPLTVNTTPLSVLLTRRGRTAPHDRVVRIKLRIRQNERLSAPTQIYVHVPSAGPPRVVGLQRP